MQEHWKPRISDERASILLYLFHLIRQNGWLNQPGIESITRNEITEVMDWFEKARDIHLANKAVKEKWLNR